MEILNKEIKDLQLAIDKLEKDAIALPNDEKLAMSIFRAKEMLDKKQKLKIGFCEKFTTAA